MLSLKRCEYNHHLYKITSNVSIDVWCESNTIIFDKNGKKYIELNVGDSDTCIAFLSELERVMNDTFDCHSSILPYTIVAKVPFRYGHFEMKVSDEDGYFLTTDAVCPNKRLCVTLVVSSVYDYGVNWMVQHITILNK
jgi:hypothetical protein